MQISAINHYSTYFTSNNGYYKAENGNAIGTYTKLFREDLNWENFTDFIIKHFKDKNKVNIIQFASSDGSEAYTQIVSLLESGKDVDKFFPIEAYDVNKNIVRAAQSGLINMTVYDKYDFSSRGIDFNKYFKKTDEELLIKHNTENTQIYKVLPILTDKVNFYNADMFSIIRDCEDDSNTVILCRNVLEYLSDREVDSFTSYCAFNLKKGSLIVTGEIDQIADEMLQTKGFIKIMPNVYMQS